MKIFKYPLEIMDNDIAMPIDSKILSVGEQNGKLFMWAMVNDQSPTGIRRITVVGTGWELKNSMARRSFLGTVQVGEYVWHVFDITAESVPV